MTYRITKWRSTSEFSCNSKKSIKIKGKFFRTATILAMLYGFEYWALKNQNIDKMIVVEIRMLI